MTPYEITILIWYYTRPIDWQEMNAPIWKETRIKLLELGLIAENTINNNSAYLGTEKLKVYIERLCETPLPELKWVYEERK